MAECWSCGAERGSATFCTSCHLIQPPSDKVDDFAALGLERKMGIDRKALDKAFREVSKAVHPDRFAKDQAQQRRYALGHTERVNQAYKRLKDRYGRAEALLELQGAVVAEGSDRTEDQALLLEMLEQQEAVASITDWDALSELKAGVKRRSESLLSVAERFFDEGQGQLEQVQEALAEGRYVRRMLQQIQRKEEELS